MDAIVESTRAQDGTLDAEASRDAVRRALSDLLTRFPDADLLNLSDEERTFVIESFVARDVFNRFQLDLGQTLQNNAPSAAAAAARVREVLDYVKQTVSASFRKLYEAGTAMTAAAVTRVVDEALRESFVVFEEYVQ